MEQNYNATRVPPGPPLNYEQRLAGNQASIALRRARASLKQDMKAGNVTLDEAMGWDWVQGMKVIDLVRALPAIRNTKARAILVQVNIPETKTLASLGSRQRERLLQAISQRGKRFQTA